MGKSEFITEFIKIANDYAGDFKNYWHKLEDILETEKDTNNPPQTNKITGIYRRCLCGCGRAIHPDEWNELINSDLESCGVCHNSISIHNRHDLIRCLMFPAKRGH